MAVLELAERPQVSDCGVVFKKTETRLLAMWSVILLVAFLAIWLGLPKGKLLFDGAIRRLCCVFDWFGVYWQRLARVYGDLPASTIQ